VRDLANGDFIDQQRDIGLVGGDGAGDAFSAIAISRIPIHAGPRRRFFNTVDLVNRFEGKSRSDRQGWRRKSQLTKRSNTG
jgi:DNA replication protein DnaC